MKRGAPLRRTGALRRGRPLAARSERVLGELDDRAVVRAAVFARDGGCLMAASPGCFGPLTAHHLRKAGQGGAYDERNLVALCARHNDWVEEAPATALAIGLVVRGDVDHDEAARRRASAGITPRGRGSR